MARLLKGLVKQVPKGLADIEFPELVLTEAGALAELAIAPELAVAGLALAPALAYLQERKDESHIQEQQMRAEKEQADRQAVEQAIEWQNQAIAQARARAQQPIQSIVEDRSWTPAQNRLNIGQTPQAGLRQRTLPKKRTKPQPQPKPPKPPRRTGPPRINLPRVAAGLGAGAAASVVTGAIRTAGGRLPVPPAGAEPPHPPEVITPADPAPPSLPPYDVPPVVIPAGGDPQPQPLPKPKRRQPQTISPAKPQSPQNQQGLEPAYDPTAKGMDIHTGHRYNYASHLYASRQLALKMAGAPPDLTKMSQKYAS